MQTVKIHWPSVVLAYFCLFSMGLFDSGRGPYFPDIMKELDLTDIQGGLYFAVPSLASFIGSLLAPKIIARSSSLMVLRYALLETAAAFSLMALAQTWLWTLIGSFGFGIGLGMVSVAQHIVIKDSSEDKSRRRLFSGLHSMYAFSSLLAPTLAFVVYEIKWSWRWGFWILVLVGTFVFLASFLVKPQAHHEAKKNRVVERGEKPSMVEFALLSAACACYVQAELAISSRLVLFMRREFSLSGADANLYLTGFFSTLLLGRLIFTLFRFERMTTRQILQLSTLGSFFCMAIGLTVEVTLLPLTGLFMAPFFAYSMDYIAQTFRDFADEGLSYAMSAISIFLVMMHYLIGVLTEVVGIRWALLVGPVGLLLSFLILTIHPKLFPAAAKS